MTTERDLNVFHLYDLGQYALKHSDFVLAAALFTAAAERTDNADSRASITEQARFATNMAEKQKQKRKTQ